jgi:hypothetical protein
MKIKTPRGTASIAKTRWLAYATASAATALGASHSTEASIHYSGRLDVPFPPHGDTIHTFSLDQPGDSLFFEHQDFCYQALFNISGIASASFRGYGGQVAYVSRLRYGRNISAGLFIRSFFLAVLAIRGTCVDSNSGPWGSGGGAGYVGFSFNNGAGRQYGWVRVKMPGSPANGFRVLDYAYADPGEPIRAGQTSVDEMVPEETDDIVPQEGSLGGLALGAAGLLAWRKSRSRAARLEST